MTMQRRRMLQFSLAGLAGAGAALSPLVAQAQQDYPSHPVRIVVGFPAGGGTDVFARVVAQGMSEVLGQ